MIDYAKEINAKAYQELERIVRGRQIGKLSDAQYVSSLATLWNVCAGLADGEFSDLATQAKGEESPRSQLLTRSFAHPTEPKIVRIIGRIGGDKVVVIQSRFTEGGWVSVRKDKSYEEAEIPSLAAKQAIEQLADKLLKQHYKEML